MITIVAVALLSTASVAAIMIRKVLFLSSSSLFWSGFFSSVLASVLSSVFVSVCEGAGAVVEVGAVMSVFFGIYAVVAAVEAFVVLALDRDPLPLRLGCGYNCRRSEVCL